MTTKGEAMRAYLESEGFNSDRMGNWDPNSGIAKAEKAFSAGWEAVIEACGGEDHIVKINDEGWTLQHPITERMEGTLFTCPLTGPVGRAYFHETIADGISKVWMGEDGNVKSELLDG